jgi:glycosyltransferase involved in cell wall biosynthesis
MKLSIYIHSLQTGGAERVAVNLANYWSVNGHDITIITNQPTQNSAYAINKNVGIQTLDSFGSTSSLSQGLLQNVKRCIRLRREIKKQAPHTVLSMGYTANVTLALALPGMRVKSIGSERSYPPVDKRGQHWELLRKHSYRLLSLVVVQTEQAKNWVLENTSAKSVEVIPNPVVLPLQPYNPTVPPPPKNNSKLILGVGRLDANKQFDHLISAFSKIAIRHNDWHLAILGEGDEMNNLKKLRAELHLETNIHFPGKVGNMSDWYKRSDILALTSGFEGFPNVLLEAMSHGLAVISYDCQTGPRDIITSGVDGYLIQPGDIRELSKKLALLITDNNLRRRLGLQARDIIMRFNEKTICSRWDAVIQHNSQ